MSEIQSIAQRVRNILAAQVMLDSIDIADDMKLSDFGADSLDVVEAAMFLEDEFAIEITDEDRDKLAPQPAREWVQYIEARMAAKVAA